MKKRLRILSTLTAACVLAANLLVGCGNKDAGADTSAATTPAATEGSATATGNELKPVELSWYFWASQMPEQQVVYDEINKYLEEKINTTIKFNQMTLDDYKQKMSLVISSGQYYDICFTSGWTNQYLPNVTKGAFYPLNDLLDQYGKEVKAVIPQALWDAVSVEGKAYGIPIYKEIGHQLGYFVDKGIADQAGIDLSTIKNWRDMEKALYTVKEKVPGVTPYAIAPDADDVALPIEHITGDWDLPAVTNVPGVNTYASVGDDTGKKVFNPYEQPEFKEFCEALYKWNKDGLTPKDAKKFQEKLGDETKAGKVFAINMWTAPNYEKVYSKEVNRDIAWVPMFNPIFEGADAFGGLMAIAKNSQNPERAMMFLNLLNTDKKLGNLIKHGIEGKHYVMSGEQVDPNGVAGINKENHPYNQSTAWQFATIFNQNFDVSYPADIAQIYLDFNKNIISTPNLGFTFDTSKSQNEIAALQNTMKEYKDGLMLGIADPAKYLPEFINKMKANGSDKLIAEVQSQLDAWRQANGK